MSAEMFQVFVAAFAGWGIAVAIKAIQALRTNQPYVFGMWDGGLLRAGKRLSHRGKQIKVAVGILMALGCIALVTGLVPWKTVTYALMAVAIASIVSDFVTEES
jgi:hypothetical protein